MNPALQLMQDWWERLDKKCFAYRDLHTLDKWETWTPSVSLTVVGTPTYTGRFRDVGRQCFFQMTAVSTTSIATTAGTSYVTLPKTAVGLGGVAVFTNDTTNIAIGVCHIDVTNSRVYPPTLVATGNTLLLAGWFEI